MAAAVDGAVEAAEAARPRAATIASTLAASATSVVTKWARAPVSRTSSAVASPCSAARSATRTSAARLAEGDGDGPAHAPGGAGDERHLALERSGHQYGSVPPSIGNRQPVMLRAASEASITATAATSSTVFGRLSAASFVKRAIMAS